VADWRTAGHAPGKLVALEAAEIGFEPRAGADDPTIRRSRTFREYAGATVPFGVWSRRSEEATFSIRAVCAAV